MYAVAKTKQQQQGGKTTTEPIKTTHTRPRTHKNQKPLNKQKRNTNSKITSPESPTTRKEKKLG